MHSIATQLESEMRQTYALLTTMTDSAAAQSTSPAQWSKKQLLGHLIDSAANNHQKIVRTAQESAVAIAAYDQQFWVDFQAYQQAPWSNLVELWRFYNRHLAFVIRHLPEPALHHTCIIGADAPVTLEWLVTDYLGHLRHHLSDLIMPGSKAELLEQIEQTWQRLNAAIQPMGEAQFLTPDATTGWTLKDHLAHLAAWEVGCAALLQKQPRWPAMGLEPNAMATLGVDGVNATLYQNHRERPLADVFSSFQTAHQQILAAIAPLTEEDLLKPYVYYQPDEAHQDNNGPIIHWIIGDTFAHYVEHLDWVGALE